MSSRIAAWPPVRSIAMATGATKKSPPPSPCFVAPPAAAKTLGIDASRLTAEGEAGSSLCALASASASRTLGRGGGSSEEEVIGFFFFDGAEM